MAQSGMKLGPSSQPGRISGQIIINELIRNMELGRLELGYSILVPCVFSVYLHPDDYARVIGVQDLLKEDARRALSARLAEWNSKPSLFRRNQPRKTYRIAQQDWWIEFFADGESSVPPGDVEIHSELAEVVQPGYRGTKTTLISREPSVTSARVSRDRAATRRQAPRVFAEIQYRDDTGPQTYHVTQDEVSIGRGGDDLWVDLPLYTGDDVSREHLRLRHDPVTGDFTITDKSRNGTWLNNKRLPRDTETPVPDQSEIKLADTLKLNIEVRR
jgi:hypothetical protein